MLGREQSGVFFPSCFSGCFSLLILLPVYFSTCTLLRSSLPPAVWRRELQSERPIRPSNFFHEYYNYIAAPLSSKHSLFSSPFNMFSIFLLRHFSSIFVILAVICSFFFSSFHFLFPDSSSCFITHDTRSLSVFHPSIHPSCFFLTFFSSLLLYFHVLAFFPHSPWVNWCNPTPPVLTPSFWSWEMMFWLHPRRCQAPPTRYVPCGQFDSGLLELQQHLWVPAPPESSRAAGWKTKKYKKKTTKKGRVDEDVFWNFWMFLIVWIKK